MRDKNLFSRTGIYQFVLLSSFFILFLSKAVFADGKYFPEKAYRVPPNIPSQRAIIVYKDCIEKLIIESALEGKGKEFGWVIPLPAEPNEFREVSPGMIKTLSVVLQPKITHDLREEIPIAFFCAGLVLSIYLIHLYGRKHRVMQFVLLIIAIFIVLSLLMPHMSKRAGFGIEGIEVKQTRDVGNYLVKVLKADNSESLDEWLVENDYSGLSGKDNEIVSEYIGDDWCFVTAKLKRNEKEGLSEPHPIAMTFPSQKAIYPVKLTSTVIDSLYIELYVISDKKALCRNLRLELCDKFKFDDNLYVNYEEQILGGFAGTQYKKKMGHPDAIQCFWDGCIVSRISGILKPSQMSEDIIFAFGEYQPYQKQYWSERGAKQHSVILLIICFTIGIIMLHAYFKNKQAQYAFVSAILLSIVLSLVLSFVFYIFLPKTQVNMIETSPFQIKSSIAFKELFLNEIIEYRKGTLDDKTIADIRGMVEQYAEELDEKIIFGDSPWHHQIFEDERGIVWRTYTGEGFPDDYILVDKSGEKNNIQ